MIKHEESSQENRAENNLLCLYQVIQNNWNQAGWYFHKIKDISIKLKYMLSGNVFQFYDQIGSNMEEQGETTDGKRVKKHWRERAQFQTCNVSQEETD